MVLRRPLSHTSGRHATIPVQRRFKTSSCGLALIDTFVQIQQTHTIVTVQIQQALAAVVDAMTKHMGYVSFGVSQT
jgi:hypothetical protein